MGPAIPVEDSRPSLTGTGTIQANATNAATVEPGNHFGTQTIQGTSPLPSCQRTAGVAADRSTLR